MQSVGSVARFESFCVHHLGTGASLTEFLVSGLGLQREHLSHIASLGGIAHAIYAAFDGLLDSAGSVPELFGKGRMRAANATVPAMHGLVTELVEYYFERLRTLASGPQPPKAILEQAIHRLYAAELRSASGRALEWNTWWRKNALPIVIMGLPGWFQPWHESKIRFSEHLSWLARVGEFFGWLDDFADYEEDYASGHANWLRFANQASIETIARRAAAKGRRVLHFWDKLNQPSPARDTFLVIVWMWLSNWQAETARSSDHSLNACSSGLGLRSS
jgi:hypothetical protein